MLTGLNNLIHVKRRELHVAEGQVLESHLCWLVPEVVDQRVVMRLRVNIDELERLAAISIHLYELYDKVHVEKLSVLQDEFARVILVKQAIAALGSGTCGFGQDGQDVLEDQNVFAALAFDLVGRLSMDVFVSHQVHFLHEEVLVANFAKLLRIF